MNTNSVIPNKRLDNIDLLKAISILMVISLHVPLWHVDFITQPTITRILQYFLRLSSEGVPLFVTINGFLLLKKTSFDVQKHYKRCAKLFGLLIFWIIAYILVLARGDLLSMSPSDFLHYIFTTGSDEGNQYTNGLWFLQFLFAVYLFVPAFWKIYHDDFKLFQTLFIISFVLVLGRNTIVLTTQTLALSTDTALLNELLGFWDRINIWGYGYYVVFFGFGGMIYHYYDWIISKKKQIICLGIVSTMLAFVYGYFMSKASGAIFDQTFNYGTVFEFFIMLAWFAGTANFNSNKNILTKTISVIGKNTFAIYIIHKIFIRLFKSFLPIFFMDHRMIVYVIVLILSTIFAVIAPKIPILRKVTSLS